MSDPTPAAIESEKKVWGALRDRVLTNAHRVNAISTEVTARLYAAAVFAVGNTIIDRKAFLKTAGECFDKAKETLDRDLAAALAKLPPEPGTAPDAQAAEPKGTP